MASGMCGCRCVFFQGLVHLVPHSLAQRQFGHDISGASCRLLRLQLLIGCIQSRYAPKFCSVHKTRKRADTFPFTLFACVCMHMYVCTNRCMYVCVQVGTHACMPACKHARMLACVCMLVRCCWLFGCGSICLYVCMYAC